MKIQPLQGLYAAFLIHLQVATQRLLIDLHDTADFLMLVTKRFQVQGFRSLTYRRMCMLSALIMQLLNFICGEFDFDHCGLLPA
jgi:hypothetical protein